MRVVRFFTMVLAASFLFAACSDKQDPNPNMKAKGKPTFAGVSITLPSDVVTRAEEAGAGITGEKSIATIGVYISDKNNGQFDYQILNVSDFAKTTNGSNQSIYKANVSVKTTTGIKYIYVVANPTTMLQNKLQSVMGTAMNPVAFGLAEGAFLTTSGATLNNMVLSGAYTATGGEYDMSVPQTSEQALATPAEITINRNLAKVVLQKGSTYRVTDGTTTLTWTVVTKAKDAHFLPQSSGTLYKMVPAEAPGSTAHAYWNNFSGLAGNSAEYINVLEYGAGDKKDAAYAESKYVFENAPTALYAGNTTAARLKGIYKPTKIFGSIVSGAPQDVGGSFVAGTDFYRSKKDGSYWTLTGRDAAISTQYNGHLATGDFLYYQGGVGYYTIYVQSDTGVKEVARNNYYLLQVNEVRGPGSPTENDDPTLPVQDDTYLGVKVTVQNWNMQMSGHDVQ